MPLALTGWEIGLFLTAAVFIVLALVASMVVPRTHPEFPSRYLGWFIAGCIVLFVGQMTAVLLLAELGEEHEEVAQENGTETTETETNGTETTETETEPPPPGGEGDPVAGKEVFLGDADCGSCHTLADAGTDGTVGPSLDESQPEFDLVVDRVTNGAGIMPPFADRLSEQQIQDVAAYVSTAAGGG